MDHFNLAQLKAEQSETGKRYLEFLRRESMSLGLYRLPAGGKDPQQPHSEDEVYVVLAGNANIEVGGEVRALNIGDVIFVPALAEHAFREITADLTLLVLFAPAESA